MMAVLIPHLGSDYDFLGVLVCFFVLVCFMNNFSKPKQIGLGLQDCYKIASCWGLREA